MLRFPGEDHLHLPRSPLKEVIGQIRYVPMLEIGESIPDFQKLVRSAFPSLGTRALQIQGREVDYAPRDVVFLDSEEKSQISLGINALAIHTSQYEGWKTYKNMVKLATDSFIRAFKGLSATRIGLRYVNEITTQNSRAKDEMDLAKSISDYFVAELNTDIWEFPLQLSKAILLQDGERRLRIRIRIDKEPEPKLVLDFDYFKGYDQEEFESSEPLMKEFELFHEKIYDAFRWSITKERMNDFS